MLLEGTLPLPGRDPLHRPPIGIQRRLGVDHDLRAARNRHHRVGPHPDLAARRRLLDEIHVPGDTRRLDRVPQVLLAPRPAHLRVAQHALQPARLFRQPLDLLRGPGGACRRRTVEPLQLLADRVHQGLYDGARALRLLRHQAAALVDERGSRRFRHLRRNALEQHREPRRLLSHVPVRHDGAQNEPHNESKQGRGSACHPTSLVVRHAPSGSRRGLRAGLVAARPAICTYESLEASRRR